MPDYLFNLSTFTPEKTGDAQTWSERINEYHFKNASIKPKLSKYDYCILPPLRHNILLLCSLRETKMTSTKFTAIDINDDRVHPVELEICSRRALLSKYFFISQVLKASELFITHTLSNYSL